MSLSLLLDANALRDEVAAHPFPPECCHTKCIARKKSAGLLIPLPPSLSALGV